METTVTTRGRFLWFDLMTPDPRASQDFYTSVIGWGTEDWAGVPEGGPAYTMWTAGGAPIGGSMDLAALDQPAPPHWLTHIGTDDLDQTLRDVASNGGTALAEARSLPEVGRYAPVRDPQGAVFMIYEPESPEPPTTPTDGQVSWNELATTDIEGAMQFYGAVFGWTKADAVDMGDDGIYQLFSNGGQWPAGGIYAIGDKPMPPAWTPYVKVPDLNAAVERARAGGGNVVVEPMEVPGGDRVAICTDPHGAFFGMHEVAHGNEME